MRVKKTGMLTVTFVYNDIVFSTVLYTLFPIIPASTLWGKQGYVPCLNENYTGWKTFIFHNCESRAPTACAALRSFFRACHPLACKLLDHSAFTSHSSFSLSLSREALSNCLLNSSFTLPSSSIPHHNPMKQQWAQKTNHPILCFSDGVKGLEQKEMEKGRDNP